MRNLDKELAKTIVTRVNAHDALVEALEKIVHDAENMAPAGEIQHFEGIAREALKLAKGA